MNVVVLPLRPPVSKVQELKGKEGREISSGGKVTWEVSALSPVPPARPREEVALESTADRSPPRVQTYRR